nr:GRIP domain-containing protein RUD3-like [Malus domestica]
MQPRSFRYVNNCLAGRRSTVDELGEPLDENESDSDWMMRLSSYVMTEYNDRLREVERYKVKFQENKQFVNDARKMSKALADAIRLKDENFESLKRQNGENVKLKKQLEATKEQLETTILEVSKRSIPTERDAAVQKFLGSQAFHDAFRPHYIQAANFEKRKWMAVLERYDNGSIIRKYRDKMDEYRQKGEAFVLTVDLSSDDDSDNEASISEQSQESEDGPGDTDEGGDGDEVETQSDIVKGSASDEDDS